MDDQDFRVFICDCDDVWEIADRSIPDNMQYFPTVEGALIVLPILRSIGQLGGQYVCDFKEWAILSSHGIIAQSENADIDGLLKALIP